MIREIDTSHLMISDIHISNVQLLENAAKNSKPIKIPELEVKQQPQ